MSKKANQNSGVKNHVTSKKLVGIKQLKHIKMAEMSRDLKKLIKSVTRGLNIKSNFFGKWEISKFSQA